MTFSSFRQSTVSRLISLCLMVTFVTSMVITPRAYAQGIVGLPEPGTMVSLSSGYVPMMITGLTIHPENPLLMDFIVNTGNTGMNASQVKVESDRLIKYFLACLTIPENNQWVNLSPYEKDRMIPDDLGATVLGQDMLAQDYLLKQLSASLIYPEKNLGKNFWDKVYTKASQMYGTTQIPINTFNKVWILPYTAQVYEHKDTVFVVKSHLKVMLDADYLALSKHSSTSQFNNLGSQVVRQVILPAIEEEVNTGKNFAQMRQIYNSMILAFWFKTNLKKALLNQVYTDRSKVNGVNVDDPAIKEKIYQQYLEAYKKGVFNYIKEEVDQNSNQVIPRKYFSGGLTSVKKLTQATSQQAMSTLGSEPGENFKVFGMTEQAMKNAPAAPAAETTVETYQSFVNSLGQVGEMSLNAFLESIIGRAFDKIEGAQLDKRFANFILRNDQHAVFDGAFSNMVENEKARVGKDGVINTRELFVKRFLAMRDGDKWNALTLYDLMQWFVKGSKISTKLHSKDLVKDSEGIALAYLSRALKDWGAGKLANNTKTAAMTAKEKASDVEFLYNLLRYSSGVSNGNTRTWVINQSLLEDLSQAHKNIIAKVLKDLRLKSTIEKNIFESDELVGAVALENWPSVVRNYIEKLYDSYLTTHEWVLPPEELTSFYGQDIAILQSEDQNNEEFHVTSGILHQVIKGSMLNKFSYSFFFTNSHGVILRKGDQYHIFTNDAMKSVNNKVEAIPTFELNNPVGHEDYWLQQPAEISDLVEDMFRDYDFRYEKTGKDLNPAVVFRLGLVWANLALDKAKKAGITNKTVLITRDARKANPEIMDALVAAMRYRGLDVIYTAADTSNAVTSYSWAVQQFKPLMSIFHTASHVSRPDDTFVRGFKVAIMDEIGGGVKSLTTKEIKQTTLPEVKKLLQFPDQVLALRAEKLGSFRAENIDKNCIRFNVLVGLIAYSKGSLYNFGEDLRKSDDPLSVLRDYEGIYANVKPLRGIKVVVDGSHTQSGYLAAETFKGLGAEVIEMNIDIQEIWGPHNADPSIGKNRVPLEDKIKETGARFGLSFDLDGDRGAIIVPEKTGELAYKEFHNLAPDNLLGVLLPPLVDQWGYKQSGKQLAIIRDVLGTHAVNDKGKELGIPVYQTDAGYPFLKAKKQALEKENVVVPMYGERSGHTWLHVSGEIENPLAVAVLFAVLAKQKMDAEALNPVYDVYKSLSVPYSQSPRSQPLFHPEFLTLLGNSEKNPTSWRYNPSSPTNPPQALIALGKDLGIKALQGKFTVGNDYETSVGRLSVKEFNYYTDPADEGGLNRYADIVFEQDGKFAGRFVFRASSNDPTFVTSYEAPQWQGEDIQTTNKRKAIIAQLVLDYLRTEKIALVTKEEITKAMPHLTEGQVNIVYDKMNLGPVEGDLNDKAMKLRSEENLPSDDEDSASVQLGLMDLSMSPVQAFEQLEAGAPIILNNKNRRVQIEYPADAKPGKNYYYMIDYQDENGRKSNGYLIMEMGDGYIFCSKPRYDYNLTQEALSEEWQDIKGYIHYDQEAPHSLPVARMRVVKQGQRVVELMVQGDYSFTIRKEITILQPGQKMFPHKRESSFSHSLKMMDAYLSSGVININHTERNRSLITVSIPNLINFTKVIEDRQQVIIKDTAGKNIMEVGFENYEMYFKNLGSVPMILEPKDRAMRNGLVEPRVELAELSGPTAVVRGGIDLSSRTLKMQSQGLKVDIIFNPAMLAQFEQGDFSGVTIKILDVTRINLVPLLGLNENEGVDRLPRV